MKRILIAATIALAAYASSASAVLPEVTIGAGTNVAPLTPYCQGFDRTLSADTVYVLTGLYYVESGFSLTIEAGTVIKGDDSSAGTLVVTRGAQIFAQGTQFRPIVFTSQKTP